MFSDAISSISWRCRPSSPLIAAAISGSASARVAVKNESGAEAVFALELALEEGGFIGEISPPPQALEAGCGRSRVAVGSGAGGIPYRASAAKRLRYKADIYARYGGDDGDYQTAEPGPADDSTPITAGHSRQRTVSDGAKRNPGQG